MQADEAIFVVTLPLLFLLLWIVIFEFLAWSGGWKRLARHYRCARCPEGKVFRSQHGRVGWVGYNGCLNIRVAPEGLHLSVWFVTRIAHPPLLIPWRDLHDLREKRFLWQRSVDMSVGAPPIASVRVPLKVLEAKRGLERHTAGEGAFSRH